jgi:hypothetical protein
MLQYNAALIAAASAARLEHSPVCTLTISPISECCNPCCLLYAVLAEEFSHLHTQFLKTITHCISEGPLTPSHSAAFCTQSWRKVHTAQSIPHAATCSILVSCCIFTCFMISLYLVVSNTVLAEGPCRSSPAGRDVWQAGERLGDEWFMRSVHCGAIQQGLTRACM